MANLFPNLFKSRDEKINDSQLEKKLEFIKRNNPRFNEKQEEEKVRKNKQPTNKIYEKWGLLISIHTISNGDVLKAKEIMELPIYDVFVWLSLDDDIIKLKTESIKKHGSKNN